jgi:hypothetical protein
VAVVVVGHLAAQVAVQVVVEQAAAMELLELQEQLTLAAVAVQVVTTMQALKAGMAVQVL